MAVKVTSEATGRYQKFKTVGTSDQFIIYSSVIRQYFVMHITLELIMYLVDVKVLYDGVKLRVEII
jgi:hypothetical protein